MATATFKFVPSPVVPGGDDIDQSTVVYFGTITFSAATDTYPTGGMLAAAGGALANLGPYADRTPIVIWIESLLGSGWWYIFNTATGKLKIFSTGGTNTNLTGQELAGGTALNATTPQIFTDVLGFEARFPRR